MNECRGLGGHWCDIHTSRWTGEQCNAATIATYLQSEAAVTALAEALDDADVALGFERVDGPNRPGGRGEQAAAILTAWSAAIKSEGGAK